MFTYWYIPNTYIGSTMGLLKSRQKNSFVNRLNLAIIYRERAYKIPTIQIAPVSINYYITAYRETTLETISNIVSQSKRNK